MVSTQQSQAPDRVALVLIDGIGDVTIPAFGDRTPLQVAHVPNMDCIAGKRPTAHDTRAVHSNRTAIHMLCQKCTRTPSFSGPIIAKATCIRVLSAHPAAAGINGLVDAVEPGLACGSDTSHMNLLGYDPRK